MGHLCEKGRQRGCMIVEFTGGLDIRRECKPWNLPLMWSRVMIERIGSFTVVHVKHRSEGATLVDNKGEVIWELWTS